MIEITGLKKIYDEKAIIDGLNFSANEGEIVGIFGAKGSGKSLFLKMIMGIVKPDEGKIAIDNKFISKNTYKDVAYVTSERALFYDMSTVEHMEYLRYYYPRFSEEIFNQYVQFFQLPINARLEKLSAEDVEKVDIALAMAKNTKYLILDDPFRGLKPKDRLRYLQTMFSNLREDKIVLVAMRNSQGMKNLVSRAFILEK
ncbi:MAG: ATP-binding cassette domain-containing protein [Lachnospiraceae bacterium]|nr:ATP-binding cassette domain-containing protein [Lachnospiraceae bacterium]